MQPALSLTRRLTADPKPEIPSRRSRDGGHGYHSEREKQVLFTTPYYDNSALFGVSKANTPVLIS